MDVEAFSLFFATLTVLADAAVVAAIVLVIAGRASPRVAATRARFVAWLAPSALPLAAIVASVATLGSLYYSEVAHFVPCKLCWYQRIAMYPLSLILWIAAARRDASIGRYVTPVATIGAVISTYHYQLERFPSQTSLGCTFDVPCTFTWIWKLHYISIPFMALSAFLLIVVLMRVARHAGAPVPEAHDEDRDSFEEGEDARDQDVDAQQALPARASR